MWQVGTRLLTVASAIAKLCQRLCLLCEYLPLITADCAHNFRACNASDRRCYCHSRAHSLSLSLSLFVLPSLRRYSPLHPVGQLGILLYCEHFSNCFPCSPQWAQARDTARSGCCQIGGALCCHAITLCWKSWLSSVWLCSRANSNRRCTSQFRPIYVQQHRPGNHQQGSVRYPNM